MNDDFAPLPADPALRGIGIRRETSRDAAFLRELYARHRADELARVAWPAEVRARFLDEQFAAQCAHFATVHPAADRLIVTRRGAAGTGAPRPAGRLYVARDEAMWDLLDISLMPAVRSKGVGGALVRWLQARAAADGAAGMTLHVAHDNPRAAALYGRLGFVDVASAAPTHRRMAWHP